MRIDKYIADALVCTRSEAVAMIKKGIVTVDGKTVKKGDLKINEEIARVQVNGDIIKHRSFIYIMMNKPPDVVSATDDLRERTVLSLLPEKYMTKGLFPAGRLDKDTVGLLILTNDGKNAHRLLSPKHHVEKEYYVECDASFCESDIEVCKKGVPMDGDLTKPCTLVIDKTDDRCAHMILTEGKYHEIKRICAYLGKKVLFLERVRFGNLLLDRDLLRGDWREMTDEEIALLG